MVNYLIVGVGNVGYKYEGTRHNIGFGFVDFLVKKYNISYNSDKLAYICNFRIKNKYFYIIKPKTFVNLSGKAVKFWLYKKKININNLLIVCDDINLDFGVVRLRKKGSSGGHNGLNSINEVLKTQDYARLRIGIGSNFERGRQSEYVLSKFSPKEQEDIDSIYIKVMHAFELFLEGNRN